MRRLLRITGGGLRARGGVQAVSAAIRAIGRRRGVIAGGIPSIKETPRHFTHALAKLGQKLQRAFIMRGRLLGLRISLRWLLVALRGGVLLRITTLRLRVARGRWIVALLLRLY